MSSPPAKRARTSATGDSVSHQPGPTPSPTPQSGSPTTRQLFREVDEVLIDDEWQVAPAPRTKSEEDEDADTIFVAHHRAAPSGNMLETETFIEVLHEGVLWALRKMFPNENELHYDEPGMDSRPLYLAVDKFEEHSDKASAETAQAVRVLLNFIRERYKKIEEKRNEITQSMIVYPLLWWIFREGVEIEAYDSLTGEPSAFVVDSWSYYDDGYEVSFKVLGHFMQWTGAQFKKVAVSKKIKQFKDVREIESLDFWPLSAERKAELHKRGKVYEQYSGIIHAEYTGSLYIATQNGTLRLRGNGRAMVDVASYRKSNPYGNAWRDDINRVEGRRGDVPAASLDPEMVYLLPPYIHAFSLVTKKWGGFLVQNLTPIKWGTVAFDHLVISDTYRSVIQSLVDVHTGALGGQLMNDVIKGKGEGVIIALHGRPGTGKTLTAEAVSEHLKTPLYTVSAGELGTTPETLEAKLNEVLNLATAWKAVLLIDEADIYLKKRSDTDIERNALVGIFLRLLEYYNGVLILTTNRIEDLDEAFASRFSLSLPFPDLTQDARKTLWQKFIRLCHQGRLDDDSADPMANFDFDELSRAEINGRVIKQSVRTAQALALYKGVPLSMEQFREVLAFTA